MSRPAARVATLIALVLAGWAPAPVWAQEGARYVRFALQGDTAYGRVDGSTVHVLSGDFLRGGTPTGSTHALQDVTLLAPVVPGKVIAVGLNYMSHLGDRGSATYPGLFAKYPSSISGPEADIVYPADATDLHYEGELVLVIGKGGKDIAPEDAWEHIFGATAGNDVSERAWQRDDLQWLRAKASDGFGPIGPVVATGLDYGDLLVETRVNGEVRQHQRTTDLIFDIPTIVSYVSRYVTLETGDLIFTGTPGTTRAVRPGDVVEVEVEGVGTIRNRVVADTRAPR
ncbi:MAG: fumarylacetoacetate hydrolase family protein [Gemmatimonadetes bacterium]|nr:fumarylacetoacetate hydrolase family protein [Gemmatimonadota bacterium]